MANLKQIDKSIEEAAVSLGAGPDHDLYPDRLSALQGGLSSRTMAFFFMRAMTTISAVLFLVSAQIKLAAIEIIFLDMDGRTASANAMCTIIIVIVLGMLLVMRLVTGKAGLKGMSAST